MVKQKHYNIPIFIAERGCPNQCVFCNQKRISGRAYIPEPSDISQIIEDYLSTMPEAGAEIEVGFFGGSFTALDMALQRAYLKEVSPYLARGRVRSVRLSTRPDAVSIPILENLKAFGVKTVELGVQSFDDGVLRKSARGYGMDEVVQASRLIKGMGMRLGVQLMLGLPGDSFLLSAESARKAVELGADDVRLYPTLVIRGTELEEWYNQRRYTPLSLEDAVRWGKEMVKIFEEAGVNLIRLGLHPSDGLLDGSDLVAGPFHPAFRELVFTSLWWDNFQNLPYLYPGEKSLEIFLAGDQLPYAIGHGSENKKKLLGYFKNVSFSPEPQFNGRDYLVLSH